MRLRVELFARVRRDARVEGLSIRELSRRHGVSRETVRAASARAERSPRKVPVRVAARLAAFKPAFDAMLVEDTTAPPHSPAIGGRPADVIGRRGRSAGPASLRELEYAATCPCGHPARPPADDVPGPRRPASMRSLRRPGRGQP